MSPTVVRTEADIARFESEMPLAARLPATSSYALLRRSAERFGDKPAILYLERPDPALEPVAIGYRDLFGRVTRAANLFASLGVSADAPVSYLLPNLPQAYAVIFGGAAAGASNAINYLLGPDEIAHLIGAARSRVLVALGPHPDFDIWDKVRVLRERGVVDQVLVIDAGHGIPEDAQDFARSFDLACAGQPADRLIHCKEPDPEDVCAYFHTGGTTGMPKLARHRQRNHVYMAWAQAFMAGLDDTDTVVGALPLYHVNATFLAGLTPFSVGATVLLAGLRGWRDPMLVQNFWRLVARFGISFFNSVPTVFSSLLQVPRDGLDLSRLRYAACGAAPLSVELHRAFEREVGVRVAEGYGLTEATCSSTRVPAGAEARIGSVGLRMPYQQVVTALLDAGGTRVERFCAPLESGAVLVRGPNVFAGYLDPAANRGVLLEDGWLNTGDLGWLDADGYLYLTGRAKDVIIRGGHNIDPQGIENALYAHPAVALAAAVGRPDPYAGELPVAFVTLRPGQGCDGETLRAFARERVPERPAAPVEVILLETMPVTGVGKIFKPALRDRSAQRAVAAALAGIGLGELVIEAREDKRLGRVVRIGGAASDADRERIRSVLRDYPLVVEFGD